MQRLFEWFQDTNHCLWTSVVVSAVCLGNGLGATIQGEALVALVCGFLSGIHACMAAVLSVKMVKDVANG